MNDASFSGEGEIAAPNVVTGATPETHEKRGRGRPRGSHNKITLESREVLAKYGPAVFERVCRIAMGRPVYSQPDERGRRTKRYPTEAAEMAAQKIVADRLLPALRAVESTIDQTIHTDEAAEPLNRRQMARAIIAALADGVGGPPHPQDGSASIPGGALSIFPAENSGRRLDGASTDETLAGLSLHAELAVMGRAMPQMPVPIHADPDAIEVGGTGAHVRRFEILADGREKWAVADATGRIWEVCIGRETAISRCESLAAKRLI